MIRALPPTPGPVRKVRVAVPESTGAINSNKIWTIQCAGPGGISPADNVSATVPAPTVDIKANQFKRANYSSVELFLKSFLDINKRRLLQCVRRLVGSLKLLNSSQSTSNLYNPQTYNYTLACSGNSSTSDTVQVIINQPIPNDPSNVTTTAPDYCMSRSGSYYRLDIFGPFGSPQSAYEVQMDEPGFFSGPGVSNRKSFIQFKF